MSKRFSFLSTTLGLVAGIGLASSSLAAPNTVPVKLMLNNHGTKIVQLLKITPSKQAAAQLKQNVQFMLDNPRYAEVHDVNAPEKTYVGMHGLPVLDQGMHGSCATFASTEGVDTVFPVTGDSSVSQLCNLELGQSLNNPPGTSGGWNGSFGYVVLGQVQDHGFLTMEYQKANGCGGLREYPARSSNIGSPMDQQTFESNSNKNFTSADWKVLHKYNGSFAPINPAEGAKVLTSVKAALNRGHVVVFGTVLNQYQGQAGAVGDFKGHNDVWTLTPAMQNINAGHEMVIDGYDDNACASYNNGQDKQCGLLRLRNSWGSFAGNAGDYYMTYDFFKTMAIEDYEVGQGVNA
ncbi:MAG: C1 family peptidase [Coxiellaceae bacterium]|nr:C1 family peptidase [Coxiellaceae bacterium]